MAKERGKENNECMSNGINSEREPGMSSLTPHEARDERNKEDETKSSTAEATRLIEKEPEPGLGWATGGNSAVSKPVHDMITKCVQV